MMKKNSKKTLTKPKPKKPKIAALLTGRGGSSLKDKNVLKILGKPLLYYPAQAALESEYIESYYVSSDDDKILDTAESLGYTPIRRPRSISGSKAQHIDAIIHGLEVMKKNGEMPDIVVVMLANTVVVKREWIDECIKALLKDSSITSASPVYNDSDHHPFRSKRIDKDGLLQPFFNFRGKKVSTNRQDLDPSYYFCHNFWVLRADNFKKKGGQAPWTFMGNRIKPYDIKGHYIDVHDVDDIEKSRQWLKDNKEVIMNGG
jgi:CMP-N,N'-diacetyllegionaminic acid synthase